ncbi:MAG: hypothetical protein AAF658_04635 [Myxococcota bacterium]
MIVGYEELYMGRFVFLQNTVKTPESLQKAHRGHVIDIVDQYDFDRSTLSGADGLLLSQHLDERHLHENRALLTGFLASGGNIALNGPVAAPYLDPPGTYHAVETHAGQGWKLTMAAPHPITEGVNAHDLTYRRGVIGFWARGTFSLPASATTLTLFKDSKRPVDYVWRSPGGGWLFVHPGNDVWGYSLMETSARRVFPQLLDWFMDVRT